MRGRRWAVLLPAFMFTTACGASVLSGRGTAVPSPAASATTSRPSVAASTSSRPAPPTTPSSATSGASGAHGWASLYKQVSSGVVRIDVANCDETGTGSGFLIGPHLVATVAHVVEGMGAIRVTAPGLALTTSAEVIGVNHDHDLALLHTDARIPGYVFRLSPTAPDIGTDMAAIGFSLGGSMQLSPGTVTGTHNHREVGGGDTIYSLSDVVLTDAAVNPGNSGGPWITADGEVIALDESGPPYSSDGQPAQGNNGGVSAVDAASHFRQWRQSPSDAGTGSCAAGPDTAQAALLTLYAYFQDINLSDYESAYAQHDDATPRGLTSFVHGVETSQDTAVDGSGAPFAEDDTGVDGDGRYVDITFQSHQDADHAPGSTHSTCSLWHIRYYFAIKNGLPLIHTAVAEPGQQLFQSC